MRKIDTNSTTWRAVKGWAEPQLVDLRKQLENSHPAEYTEKLRGRIHELKALLALPDQVNKED